MATGLEQFIPMYAPKTLNDLLLQRQQIMKGRQPLETAMMADYKFLKSLGRNKEADARLVRGSFGQPVASAQQFQNLDPTGQPISGAGQPAPYSQPMEQPQPAPQPQPMGQDIGGDDNLAAQQQAEAIQADEARALQAQKQAQMQEMQARQQIHNEIADKMKYVNSPLRKNLMGMDFVGDPSTAYRPQSSSAGATIYHLGSGAGFEIPDTKTREAANKSKQMYARLSRQMDNLEKFAEETAGLKGNIAKIKSIGNKYGININNQGRLEALGGAEVGAILAIEESLGQYTLPKVEKISNKLENIFNVVGQSPAVVRGRIKEFRNALQEQAAISDFYSRMIPHGDDERSNQMVDDYVWYRKNLGKSVNGRRLTQGDLNSVMKKQGRRWQFT